MLRKGMTWVAVLTLAAVLLAGTPATAAGLGVDNNGPHIDPNGAMACGGDNGMCIDPNG